MADSTEDTVRTALIGAIESIGSALGFDRSNGNVQPYLLEEEIPERYTEYLMASIGAEQRVRAWGVQVYGREDFDRAQSTEKGTRFYEIVLDGYYGVHGETPINTVLTDARAVRKAVYDLHLHLSQTVDKLSAIGRTQIERLLLDDLGWEVFRVRMELQAEKSDPQW